VALAEEEDDKKIAVIADIAVIARDRERQAHRRDAEKVRQEQDLIADDRGSGIEIEIERALWQRWHKSN
jgi:hypothetical protein